MAVYREFDQKGPQARTACVMINTTVQGVHKKTTSKEVQEVYMTRDRVVKGGEIQIKAEDLAIRTCFILTTIVRR